MSIQDLFDGIRLVTAIPQKAFFVGERAEGLVRSAEIRLGIIFPPTYRQFLLKLGAGNFGSAEFYGVTTDNFDSASIPNGIWFTVVERREAKLPQELVAIGVTSYGELYCIDTSMKPEGPVVVYQAHLQPDEQEREIVAEDFGAFFLDQIKAQL